MNTPATAILSQTVTLIFDPDNPYFGTKERVLPQGIYNVK